MLRLLQEQPRFAEAFLSYILTHSICVQEDLVDQLFNSTARSGWHGRCGCWTVLEGEYARDGFCEDQLETVANMVGTTRSRLSFFMNKYCKLGFIDYKGGSRQNSELHVHSSLLNVVLPDQGLHLIPLH